MRDRFALQRLLTENWCTKGEKLVFLVGGEHKNGWTGATVDGVVRAPHPSEPDDIVSPQWPMVGSVVADLKFLGDEWVHDPAVWGWAHAGEPGAAAARCAEALNRGRHFSWLVCTDRRVAVVVEDDEFTAAVGSAEPAEPSGGWGGLLTKAKSWTGDGKRAKRPENPIGSWWECPVAHVAEFTAAELGRALEPVEFFRIHFADGSMFEFRLINAPDLVRTVQRSL